MAAEFLITETEEWLVSHRMDSALPGYLIVASRTSASDLSDLSDKALREIGPLLALVQTVLRWELRAGRVYIGRYGHQAGHSFHFHVIPIYGWVEELFWQDERYRTLRQFTDDVSPETTDGAELTLFVWREFCERLQPPPIEGPTVPEVILLFRNIMHARSLPIDT